MINHQPPARLTYREPTKSLLTLGSALRLVGLCLALAFLVASFTAAKVEPSKLVTGMPKIAGWLVQMFPPDLSEIDSILFAAFQTLAMATVGTIFALMIAAPLVPLAARNTTPNAVVYRLVRALFSILRSTEMLVFALIFVAAVGFGPFTGVLAITFNMTGALGKLLTEVIEPADPGPIEAVSLTGAGPIVKLRYALIPDVWPNIVAVCLYIWEFNVRASTVLGIVGAGGIGQTLKDSIDLLDFPKLSTVLLTVLTMVIAIDMLSGWVRRRVLDPDGGHSKFLAVPERLETV